MHAAAHAFVAQVVTGQSFGRVVEVGGRDINGGVRDLVECTDYLCVDLEDGPAVDVIGDCRQWSPPWPADLVVCCEVLEHSPDPVGVLAACVGYLAPGGLLVVTCAGPGRGPHSGHDGGTVRPGEHYANIEPGDLAGWLLDGMAAELQDIHVVWNEQACDVYATAVRR